MIHQLLHVFPCAEINSILTSCYMHVFSSSFLEGCLLTLENFQRVKVILHEVSICEWYQVIMPMTGFHYMEVRDFQEYFAVQIA